MKIKILSYITVILVISCTQPEEIPDPDLTYIWSGAPTKNSINIKFKTAWDDEAKVVLFKTEDLEDTVAISDWVKTSKETYYTGSVDFINLDPNTTYYYSLLSRTTSSDLRGKFKTLPEGPASFKIAFASCARTGSNSDIYATINSMDPLFYMNVGDFHYGNIDQNCSYNFAETYFDILSTYNQSTLYRSRPFVYIWDDHDFGPNNSASNSKCREEALESYRLFIPHYPLALEGDDSPISQAVTVGRVRFVLTDLRSHKIRPEYDGCERTEEGSNFGFNEHLEWFKEELIAARDSGQIVAWVNPIPWISTSSSPKYECDEDDDWGGFPEERQEIANFIKDNQIKLFILSGDAHMLAIDDGTNSDFATGGGAPIPVFHAAPLDNVGIIKGGPYSHGYSRKRGQFGVLEVEDSGADEICITFSGMANNGRIATNQRGQYLQYRFCSTLN